MTDTKENPNTQGGRVGSRSPAYPRIDLGQGIERARQIYKLEGRNKVHISTAFEHWGYKKISGSGSATQAALKYYGLIDIVGSGDDRKVHLTDLALDILMDERENSKERKEAIKKAALTPSINSKLWDEYEGNLPSDKELEFALKREMKFTENGAKEFLSCFRSTLEYAELTPSSHDIDIKDDTEDKPKEEEVPQQVGQAGIRNITLPLTSSSEATLYAQFPLTEEEWDQMLKVLEVMKPGLVEKEMRQLPPPT